MRMTDDDVTAVMECAWSLPVGDGGLLGTDDGPLAAKVRSLRSHARTSVTRDRHKGHQESYDIVDLGFNFRLDEPRAALAAARLDRFAEWPPGL